MISNLQRIVARPDQRFISAPVTTVDGRVLLRSYRALRDFLDEPHPPFQISEDERLDLKLLVEGFLEDRDFWYPMGFMRLSYSGDLDPVLWNKFLNRQLRRGIRSLDNAFRKADGSGARSNEELELAFGMTDLAPDVDVSSSDLCGPTNSIFELDSTPTSSTIPDRSARGSCEPTPSNQTSPSLHKEAISLEDVFRSLPSHYPIDYFFDNLSEEHPQLLPVVSRTETYPLIFGDELNENFATEGFYQQSARHEQPEQIELDASLIAACRSGTLTSVISILEKGASSKSRVTIQDQIYTPLIAAVEANQQEIVRHLVRKGADIEEKCLSKTDTERLEYTALFAATRMGNISMMQLLLELRASINEVSTREEQLHRHAITPLQEAIRLKDRDAFWLLLLWDTSYSTGLKQARMAGDGGPSLSEATMLLDMVKTGNQSRLEDIIKIGADVNAVSFEGSPLSVAASFNQAHKIKLLLKYGADVHLASLYLSRTNQNSAAKLLVKTADGGIQGVRNVRNKFIRQYGRLVNISQSSPTSQLRAFKRECPTYQQGWTTGIRVMDNICCGKVPNGPNRLSDTLAFLIVARAVAETSAGDTGDINLIDKFDSDLLRWQMVFPEADCVAHYREAVRSLWSVELSGKFFLDLDFDDTETLGSFQGIIARIIDGVRGPLELDKEQSTGLNETYERWRKHRREPTKLHPQSVPASVPLPDEQVIERSSPSRPCSATRIENVTSSIGGMPEMTREQILQSTEWLTSRRVEPVKIYFFDMTGVASNLVRGVIFSIVFVFIHGNSLLQHCSWILGANMLPAGLKSLPRLHVTRGFGIVERFSILVQFLGFLETLENITSGLTAPSATQTTIRDEATPTCLRQDNPQAGPLGKPCDQWYSLLGNNDWAWNMM